MIYKIQCRTLCNAGGEGGKWYTFASANEYSVAMRIMQLFVTGNDPRDFDYQIIETLDHLNKILEVAA